jgi:elongation factor G
VVKAIVPQADLHLYGTRLSSLTHGRGTFTHRFHGYEQMPQEHATKVIAAYEKTRKEEVEE